MEQPKTTTCATDGCKNKTTDEKKKLCGRCFGTQQSTKAFMALGIDEDNASAFAAGKVKGTKCLSCKKHTGISFVQGSTHTIMCIACMIVKMQPAGSVTVTPVVAATTAISDRDCNTCKELFTPTSNKQHHCLVCMAKHKTNTDAPEQLVERACKISTCEEVFTPTSTKQYFCLKCLTAFRESKAANKK
jgi:hypothetical protein